MLTANLRPSFLLRLGNFVRFSHTVFALPFALISMIAAGNGRIPLPIFAWILICMVASRTAAMCFNRLVDWDLDKLNPRTQDRHQLVTRTQGWIVLTLSSVVAIASSFFLNSFCFRMSPLMLGIIFFYSLTKRFTAFSHFFLGIALGVAPLGAWAAIKGSLFWAPEPFSLALGVVCWTFGFDLIYSTLDANFDKEKGLFSFPSRYGIPASLRLARILHLLAALCFGWFGSVCNLGLFYWLALALSVGAIVWEHKLASSLAPKDINRAFFQINAIVSITLFLGTALHFYVGRFLGV